MKELLWKLVTRCQIHSCLWMQIYQLLANIWNLIWDYVSSLNSNYLMVEFPIFSCESHFNLFGFWHNICIYKGWQERAEWIGPGTWNKACIESYNNPMVGIGLEWAHGAAKQFVKGHLSSECKGQI